MKQKLLLILAIFCISFGSAQTFAVDGINYNVTDPATKTVEVIEEGFGGYTGAITIPQTVVGGGITYTVTAIGDNAFFSFSGATISSIIIPNSVTSIGNNAFGGCINLVSLTIPNSVIFIGNSAFSNCSRLTSMTLPDSVTSIGQRLFFGCTSLTSITIPDSVTSIGNDAFYDCSGLTSILIPNSVTSIGYRLFFGCTSLSSVTISNSLTSTGIQTFVNCSSLASITIPNSVTSIGDSSFNGCSSLTSITIPTSVTSIENYAFGASGLTSIVIPPSVTSIGASAFYSCLDLTSITIPASVTSIGDGVFEYNTQLTSIICEAIIPLTIGANVFQNFVQSAATLYVPFASISAYKSANSWKNFNITSVLAPSTSYPTQVYAGDDKTIASLQVSGTAIKWYDAAIAGSVLQATTVLVDGTIYYASQTLNGLEGERLAITVKRISDAKQTFLSSTNPTVANLVSTPSTDYTSQWFTVATGGTVLENSTLLTNGDYYVDQEILTTETLGSGFIAPRAIAIQPDGKIIVADTENDAIKSMNADGSNIVTLASGFIRPNGVAIQSDGKILIADNSGIKRMDADGRNIVTLGSGIDNPTGLAVQADGKILISGITGIKRMDIDGSNIVALGSGFDEPSGVAVQSDGKILVLDFFNYTIKRMDANGNNIENLGGNFGVLVGLAIQSDGKILVAANNPSGGSIRRMDADGSNIEILNSGFNRIEGIAVQSNDKILFADLSDNSIKRVTAAVTSNRVAVEVVVKAQPTITFADLSKTYGDANFDLAAISNSTGVISYEIIAGGTGSATLSGTNNAIVTVGNIGTVLLKATVAEDANYNAASKTITLTINKATLTGITFANASSVYDGTAKSLVIAGTLPTGTTVSYANNSRTIAGTQEVIATISGANYTTLELKADLTITKATITGITFANASSVYDGTAKSLEIAGTLPAGTTVSYANNSLTNVGTQEVTATIDGANYTTLELKANLTITKATITGVTFVNASSVFDSTAKSLVIAGTLPTGTTVSYANNSLTNVGTQEVTATISGANYTTLELKANLAITKATITGISFANASSVYDGTVKSLAIA
jgi:sugar lactone lactonase YvrE